MRIKKSAIKLLLSALCFMCHVKFLLAAPIDETRRYNYFSQFRPSEPFIALNNDARINLLFMLGETKGFKVLNQDYAVGDYINLSNDRMLDSFPSNNHYYAVNRPQDFETTSQIYTKYLITALSASELKLSERLYLVNIYPILLNTAKHFTILPPNNPTEKFKQHILLLTGISEYRETDYKNAFNYFYQVNLKQDYASELAAYFLILAIDNIQKDRLLASSNGRESRLANTYDEYELYTLFDSTVFRIHQYIDRLTLDLFIKGYQNNFINGDFMESLMRHQYKNHMRIKGDNLEIPLTYFNQTLADIDSYSAALYWVSRVNDQIFKNSDTDSIKLDLFIGVIDTIRLLRKHKNKENLDNLKPNALLARVNTQVDLLKANRQEKLALLLELFASQAFNNNKASAYYVINRLDEFQLSKPKENDFVELALWNLKADAYEMVNIYSKSESIWQMLSALELSSSQLFYVQTRLANVMLLQNRFDYPALLAMQKNDQFSNLTIRAAIYRQIETDILIKLLTALDKQLTAVKIDPFVNQVYKNDWDVIYGQTDFDVVAEILTTRHIVMKDPLFIEKYKKILKKSQYWQLNIEEMVWHYGHFLTYLLEDPMIYNASYFYAKCKSVEDTLNLLIQSDWKDTKAQYCLLGSEFILHKTKPLELLPSRTLALSQSEFESPVNSMLLSIAMNKDINTAERKLAFKTLVDCNTRGNLQDFYRYSCEVKVDAESTKQKWIKLYRDYFNENLIYQNPSYKLN